LETSGFEQGYNLSYQISNAHYFGETKDIYRGALLHDIGKMGVPDKILQKTGKLTAEEWQTMHKHPIYAHQWLSPIEYLKPALDIPYCHHEKWDGTGYPRGLKGEEIPIAARIFSIIDYFCFAKSGVID